MSQHMKYLLPRVLFTFGLCGISIWYLWDAALQSTSATNLVLLLPATVIAVLLSVAVIADEVAKVRRMDGTERSAKNADRKLDWRIPTLMALVGLYVLVTMTVGLFDVATVAFVAASLVLLGERRLGMVTVFSVAFSLVVVWGLEATLSYDVPTLLL